MTRRPNPTPLRSGDSPALAGGARDSIQSPISLLLLSLLVAAALWGPGIVNTRGGGDSPFLLQRTHQLAVNLRAGVFPVRWMPDAAYGLGFPFFNHYAALPFYLAAFFNLLGLDILTALKLTQTLGFVIAALAMYGWVHHLWRNRAAAWLAAVAYTVAPFHLVNVYVRGDSLSEFYAFTWYPLILWALQRRKIWFLALTYAGLTLTHNISALIFSPFILLYLLFLAWRHPEKWRTLGMGVGGLLLGLALSAWFWIPSLLETKYGQTQTLILGYFHYSQHLRTTDLVQPGLFFDYSIAPTPGDPGPFAMGAPQAAVALAGLFALLRLVKQGPFRATNGRLFVHRPAKRSFVFLALGLLLSTIMITSLSRPLWDHLPLLEKTQFPWRFLSVQALFTAAATGALVLRLQDRRAWGVAVAIAVLLVASVLVPLRPERLPIGPRDVTATRLQEYELFSGNIGTTIRHEWLPRETVPRPFISDALIEPDAPPQAIPLAGGLDEAVQTQRRPTERVWRVAAGDEGATLAFPLLYWPGWRAWVDGQRAPIDAVEGSGHLSLTVPPGQHTVHLKLGRTPLRARAETLSLITLLILLAFTLWQTKSTPRATHYVLRLLPSLLILLIGLLFLASRSSPVGHTDDDLTMDFDAMPYLHHNPGGVDFAGQARLLSYTFSADQLAPGDTLTAALEWDEQALDGERVTLRLVSPAEHIPNLQSGPLTLAESVAPLAESTLHRLVLPDNTPRGLYLVQVQLGGAGAAPHYLRPVRVSQGAPLQADAPLLALVGPDIRLHAASATHSTGALHLRLEWSTARWLAANYGVSVRLLDPEGNQRASRDTQPGYGFAPTSLWRPGERVGDHYNLPLPGDLPPGDGYRLVIVFYRHPSLAQVAQATLGPFALPLEAPVVFEPPQRLFELPPLSHPLDVDFTGDSDHIRLAGYDLLIEDAPLSSLRLTLWWIAQRQTQADYTVFVHLFDPETEAIPVQHDAMPRQGSYPTSGWLPGEVVSDTVQLSLDGAPPGSYRLAVGLYVVATSTRLSPIASDGAPLPDGRLILPEEIEVRGE